MHAEPRRSPLVSFRVTRIPKRHSEEHVQRILAAHFPGALVCLEKPKKKVSFVEGRIAIPYNTVTENDCLQKARHTDNGHPIFPSPLPKLFLHPVKFENELEPKSDKVRIKELERRIANLESALQSLNFEEQLAPILAPLQHQLKVLASLVQNPAPSPPRKRNKHDQNPVMFS